MLLPLRSRVLKTPTNKRQLDRTADNAPVTNEVKSLKFELESIKEIPDEETSPAYRMISESGSIVLNQPKNQDENTALDKFQRISRSARELKRPAPTLFQNRLWLKDITIKRPEGEKPLLEPLVIRMEGGEGKGNC